MAHAISNVYRGDTREPNDVFTRGFESEGENHNLLDHVIGSSCEAGLGSAAASAYVSTTNNRQVAHDAMNAVNREVHGHTYIYTITPHIDTYYDVGSILRAAINIDDPINMDGVYSVTQVAALRSVYNRFSPQGEVVTHRVYPQDIVSVAVYDAGGHFVQSYSNAGYQNNPVYDHHHRNAVVQTLFSDDRVTDYFLVPSSIRLDQMTVTAYEAAYRGSAACFQNTGCRPHRWRQRRTPAISLNVQDTAHVAPRPYSYSTDSFRVTDIDFSNVSGNTYNNLSGSVVTQAGDHTIIPSRDRRYAYYKELPECEYGPTLWSVAAGKILRQTLFPAIFK